MKVTSRGSHHDEKESNSYQVRKDENSRKRSSRKVTKVGKKSKKICYKNGNFS